MAQINKYRPLALVVAMAAILSGCGESTSSTAGSDYGDKTPSTPTPPTTTFNETKLLVNLTDNVITPTYQAFKTLATSQQQAVIDYCSAEKSYVAGSARTSVDTSLTAAKTSWQQAMAVWQEIEVMQIGPLLANSSTLRNNIYSWPVVSSCGVDQDTMYFANGDINGTVYDISRRTATRRGLDALEYLLFNPILSHSCKTTPTVLNDWNKKSTEQQRITRCNFASEVSKDLIVNSDILLGEWLGDTGYANKLKTAGSQGSRFESAHAGVNAISDGLFYLDKISKDAKLAKPLGICKGCTSGIHPESVESPYSDNSVNNLISNLKGFEKLFLGNGSNASNTTGFDDYLIEQKSAATSTNMIASTKAAIAQLKTIEKSLATTLNENPDKITASHAKLKSLTDQLKNDFITNLALKLPETAAGDND